MGRILGLVAALFVLFALPKTVESVIEVAGIPHHGEDCDKERWTSHVELIYERDRRAIEGFNSFLKAIVERTDMETQMLANNISKDRLCDFGKAEVLYCDSQKQTCQCGGKWQKLETKLMVINGMQECRAELFTKCRAEAESPFKQFKGWSPCEPGSICKLRKSKDVIRQATPKYGTCVCDVAKYNGKVKKPTSSNPGTNNTNPIRKCGCTLEPCKASVGFPPYVLILLLGTFAFIS